MKWIRVKRFEKELHVSDLHIKLVKPDGNQAILVDANDAEYRPVDMDYAAVCACLDIELRRQRHIPSTDFQRFAVENSLNTVMQAMVLWYANIYHGLDPHCLYQHTKIVSANLDCLEASRKDVMCYFTNKKLMKAWRDFTKGMTPLEILDHFPYDPHELIEIDYPKKG